MADFTIKQGARLPGIETILTAPNAHLATAVAFHMRDAAGVAAAKTGAAVIVDASKTDELTVAYDWGASDTDTIGSWLGEWWLTIAGKVMKLPLDTYLDIEVLDDAV